MKNLELEMMGVQEMGIVEMNEYTGGVSPIPFIVTGATVVAVVALYVIGLTTDN